MDIRQVILNNKIYHETNEKSIVIIEDNFECIDGIEYYKLNDELIPLDSKDPRIPPEIERIDTLPPFFDYVFNDINVDYIYYDINKKINNIEDKDNNQSIDLNIPNELLCIVFGYLNYKNMMEIKMVCSLWNKLSYNSWKSLDIYDWLDKGKLKEHYYKQNWNNIDTLYYPKKGNYDIVSQNIKYLHTGNTSILQSINTNNIQYIHFFDCNITNIDTLHNLQKIKIKWCKYNKDIYKLFTSSLTYLYLDLDKKKCDSLPLYLLENCPNLEILTLLQHNDSTIFNKFIKSCKQKLPKLQMIDIYNCNFNPKLLIHLNYVKIISVFRVGNMKRKHIKNTINSIDSKVKVFLYEIECRKHIYSEPRELLEFNKDDNEEYLWLKQVYEWMQKGIYVSCIRKLFYKYKNCN